MEVLAKLEFLEVDDPECNVRYLNKSRPRIVYEGQEGSSCIYYLGDEVEEAFPGETLGVEIALMPEVHTGIIKVGLEFEMYAGEWKIAKGIFTFVDDSSK